VGEDRLQKIRRSATLLYWGFKKQKTLNLTEKWKNIRNTPEFGSKARKRRALSKTQGQDVAQSAQTIEYEIFDRYMMNPYWDQDTRQTQYGAVAT